MSGPPESGSYGYVPPGGGHRQARGAQPPQQPGPPPYGAPHPNHPGGQPQWGPPPPSQPDKTKWILGGVALAAVIALTIVSTILFTRPDPGPASSTPPGQNGSEFASASDVRPANIITDDPTCPAWVKISDQMSSVSDAVDWNNLNYSVPESNWTSDQRAAFEKKGAALTTTIDKVRALSTQTPHRTMRELYSQYVAYSQALIESIPSYAATDQYNVQASNRFFSALNKVCDAIHFQAAQERAPLIPAPSPPSKPASADPGGTPEAQRLLDSHNDLCGDWIATVERVDNDTANWRAIDPAIPAAQWTSEQKSVIDAVTPAMATYADDLERLGRRTDVPEWEDFATFSAQYMRAFVQTLPEYTPSDSYLAAVTVNLSSAVYWACKAVS